MIDTETFETREDSPPFAKRLGRQFRSPGAQRLSREGAWVILGKILTVAGSVFGVRILTALLPATEYGKLALGMTLAVLVDQIVMGPLGNGSLRFFSSAKEARSLPHYVRAVRRLGLKATGFVSLLTVLVATGLYLAGRTAWIGMASLALLFSVLSGYNEICNGIQNAARQRIHVALHSAAFSWGRYLVAAALLTIWGPSGSMAMTGYAVAVAATVLSQMFFLRKLLPIHKPLRHVSGVEWERKMWGYSWPFALWGMFTWAQMASGRWALGLFGTPDDIGLYAVVYQLGYMPVAMLVETSLQLIAPVLFQRAGDACDARRNREVKRACLLLSLLALLGTGAIFLVASLFHRQIFGLLVAEAYRETSSLFPWMILAGGIFAAGQTMSLNMMSRLRTKSLACVKIGTALAGVLASMLGAKHFGVSGAVGGALVFSVLYGLCIAALFFKKEKNLESA